MNRLAKWVVAPLCGATLVANSLLASAGTSPDVDNPAPVPAAQPLLPVPVTQRTVSIPSSIDPTGTKNITAELNRFFYRVPDNTTVIFPAHAIYRSEGTIVLGRKVGLILDGNGAVLKATTDGFHATPTPGYTFLWPRNRASILVRSSSNIRIENLTIIGPNNPGGYGSYHPALEAQHGVDIEASTSVAVADCIIRHVYGDFVYISGGSSNVQVLDNTLSQNGRQGVSVTNARYVLIEGNSMYDVSRSAIDLEPPVSAWVARYVDIYNNTIVKAGLSFVASEGAGPHVDYINIVGNKLINMPMTIEVPRLGRSPPPRLEHNGQHHRLHLRQPHCPNRLVLPVQRHSSGQLPAHGHRPTQRRRLPSRPLRMGHGRKPVSRRRSNRTPRRHRQMPLGQQTALKRHSSQTAHERRPRVHIQA